MIFSKTSVKKFLCAGFFISVAGMVFAKKVPEFQDYVAQPYVGQHKTLKLDQQSKKYKTLLKNASLQLPNFAGHYVMDIFGCGGGCSAAVVYNAKTGQGFLLPDQFSDCYHEKKGFTANDIFFHQDSRLVMATGRRTGEVSQCEIVYYLVEKNHFKQILSLPK